MKPDCDVIQQKLIRNHERCLSIISSFHPLRRDMCSLFFCLFSASNSGSFFKKKEKKKQSSFSTLVGVTTTGCC